MQNKKISIQPTLQEMKDFNRKMRALQLAKAEILMEKQAKAKK